MIRNFLFLIIALPMFLCMAVLEGGMFGILIACLIIFIVGYSFYAERVKRQREREIQ